MSRNVRQSAGILHSGTIAALESKSLVVVNLWYRQASCFWNQLPPQIPSTPNDRHLESAWL